ncbi:hypothetical protein PVAP13_2NG261500 [Panicum virgatum]|uniref:Cathepsin propeptide inhibitor domain-containing protein n=1 Tax=Panicum virgatum TaxID=38727 RepID=A0A8T0VEM8_PANVG|nr:hypothetical protein PVAP13_2NG261500 [Panicum virgatum]
MVRSALYVVALAAAIALALTQASFTFTEEDLASDDSMWALYERWAAHHEHVVVHGHGEKARRFAIFKNNTRWIRDRYGNKGKYAINIFGDMTYEEITTVATGLRP